MHYFKPYLGVITDETKDAFYMSFAGKRTRISKPANDGIPVQAVLFSRQYRDFATDGPYRVQSVYQSIDDAVNAYKNMDMPLNRIRASGSEKWYIYNVKLDTLALIFEDGQRIKMTQENFELAITGQMYQHPIWGDWYPNAFGESEIANARIQYLADRNS